MGRRRLGRGLFTVVSAAFAAASLVFACSSHDSDPPVLTGCSGSACGSASGGGGGGSAPLDGDVVDDASGFDVQQTDAGLVPFDSGLNFTVD